MKKIILVIVLCLFLYNCSSSDSQQTNQMTQDIQGKWQLVQNLYYDSQDPTNEHYVTNGVIYEFKSDGTFLSNNPENNASGGGTYTITNDSIINFNINTPPNYSFKEKFLSVSSTTLDLSDDLTGNTCFEGCGKRFKKIIPSNQ